MYLAISLKPYSYKSKSHLSEDIKADIIFYEKEKDGIKVIIPEILERKLKK